MSTISPSLAPERQIGTGCERPASVGPITRSGPSSCSILVGIEAARSVGTIATHLVEKSPHPSGMTELKQSVGHRAALPVHNPWAALTASTPPLSLHAAD